MAWIKIIPFDQAVGQLKKLYERVKGPDNIIDNVLSIHSLRPHTLKGHMELYKNVLHNSSNTLPKWYLETLGVYVSYLNQCSYCVDHHFEGLKRLVNDDSRSNKIFHAIQSNNFLSVFDERERAGLFYAEKLTHIAHVMKEEDISNLRSVGFDEGECLEINQVVSYFNYVNRTVLGLGVTTDGDILGLSPNDTSDAENWGHS